MSPREGERDLHGAGQRPPAALPHHIHARQGLRHEAHHRLPQDQGSLPCLSDEEVRLGRGEEAGPRDGLALPEGSGRLPAGSVY